MFSGITGSAKALLTFWTINLLCSLVVLPGTSRPKWGGVLHATYSLSQLGRPPLRAPAGLARHTPTCDRDGYASLTLADALRGSHTRHVGRSREHVVRTGRTPPYDPFVASRRFAQLTGRQPDHLPCELSHLSVASCLHLVCRAYAHLTCTKLSLALQTVFLNTTRNGLTRLVTFWSQN